jgi:hypothetical protein
VSPIERHLARLRTLAQASSYQISIIIAHARRLIIGPDTTHEQAIRRLIAPFQNPDINLHLFARLLERILLTIEPRLANDDTDDQLR